MTVPKHSYWYVEARVARLKELWNEGYTAKIIAAKMTEEFQIIITRNAIISQVHRQGLELRRRGAGPRKPRKSRAKVICEEVEERELEYRPRKILKAPKHERTKSELYQMLADAVRNTK